MAVLSVTLLTACVVTETDEPTPTSPGPSTQMRTDDAPMVPIVSPLPADPVVVVDVIGRTWSVRKVTAFAAPPDTYARNGAPGPNPYAGLSDEEIALAQRAVGYRVTPDGVWEYREVYPDVKRVRAALAKERAGVQGYSRTRLDGSSEYVEISPSFRSIDGQSGIPDIQGTLSSVLGSASKNGDTVSKLASSGSRHSPVGMLSEWTLLRAERAESHAIDGNRTSVATPNTVFGGDGRQWTTHAEMIPPTTAPKYARYGRLTISMTSQPWGGAGCTAQLIGRATALTAAHCIWNGQLLPPKAFNVGVVQTNHPILGPQATYSYGPWNGCYWVWFPSGYSDPGPTQWSEYLDYAVLDFNVGSACGITWPGDVVGWSNFYVSATPSMHHAASSWLHAYDANSPLPTHPLPTTHVVPSVINRSAPHASTGIWPGDSSGLFLATTLDLTGGASGGGLQQNLNPLSTGPAVVGTITSEDVSANFARRLEQVYWAFVQAYAWEY